jgi:CRISPR/Cas system CSM-associated protein Csm3 (group 7 of RAMP superfamily)
VFRAAEDGLCDLCKLFGSPLYASRLVVADAYPVDANAHPLKAEILNGQAQVRDCVGIDRDTGSARDGVKFDYEVLEPKDGLRFGFDMQVENLGEKDRLILNLLLALLQQGLYVGGKRAGGLGRIHLEGLGVRCLNRDNLKQALTTGKLETQTVAWGSLTC